MFNIFNSLGWLIHGKTPNLNALTASDYYDRLRLIALSLFEWEGLPEGCNARHLESSLYLYGRALFYKDDTKGYMNSKCTPSGTLNHYDEPVAYTATSTVYNVMYKRDECVLIRNNYLERPTDHTVVLFASRLTEAERTIDVNIKAQKTPVMITCDEKDRLTMLALYKKYEENECMILGSKQMNTDKIKVFKTDAPFIADKMQVYKRDIMNEMLTFFGINNTNSDKRERLITDEVNANNEVIDINSQSMLLTRLEACQQINTMFPDLKVSVRMRTYDEIMERQSQEKEVTE
jgi:hypothetical protein